MSAEVPTKTIINEKIEKDSEYSLFHFGRIIKEFFFNNEKEQPLDANEEVELRKMNDMVDSRIKKLEKELDSSNNSKVRKNFRVEKSEPERPREDEIVKTKDKEEDERSI